jgi:hypothetical protein
MGEIQADYIDSETWLTQAGKAYPSGGYEFQHALRPESEAEVSLILGRLSPTDACDIRALGERARRMDQDAARYARAGRLRDLGFEVEHTPELGTADHVSAYRKNGEAWDAETASKFCRAFRAPVQEG